MFAVEVGAGEGVGDDDRDVFFLSGIIDDEVDEFAVVAGGDGVDASLDGVEVSAHGVGVVLEVGDGEGRGVEAVGFFVEDEEEAGAEEDDDSGENAEGGGGAGFGRCAAGHVAEDLE